MADTVAIALVGALILTLTLIPVLCAYAFKNGVHERVNKPFEWVRDKYAGQLEWCLDHPKTTMIGAILIFGASLLLIPFIGGEFMPHLDEGALWVRATMPYTVSFDTASKLSPQVRNILLKYPMVTDVGSELGRPDDGTDPTGFFNDEFYVGLKPYSDDSWKTGSIHNKAELTADIQRQIEAFPGIIFNYTQPAEDAVDEALTGLKSALAVKIYGPDLNVLQTQALEIKRRLSHVPGFTELTVVRELGQPSLLIDVDRDKIARYGINVADVEAIVQAAVGGQAATQVIQGEKLFDLVVRMKPEFRENAQQIGNLLVGTPSGQQIPLSELADIHEAGGASFIYRENNSRYIGVQYSIEGRDLQSAVNAGQRSIADITKSLPPGYRIQWGGEYGELLEAKHQMEFIGPLAVLIIFMILFALYGNFKFPLTIALGVILTEPVGALIALQLTAYTIQRLVRARLARVDGRFGRNRRHPCFLHQQTAHRRQRHSHRNTRSFTPAFATHHDDRARCLSGAFACGAFHRHRLRHAEAICHRNRSWPGFPALPRLLRKPGALRNGRSRWRCFAGLTRGGPGL